MVLTSSSNEWHVIRFAEVWYTFQIIISCFRLKIRSFKINISYDYQAHSLNLIDVPSWLKYQAPKKGKFSPKAIDKYSHACFNTSILLFLEYNTLYNCCPTISFLIGTLCVNRSHAITVIKEPWGGGRRAQPPHSQTYAKDRWIALCCFPTFHTLSL